MLTCLVLKIYRSHLKSLLTVIPFSFDQHPFSFQPMHELLLVFELFFCFSALTLSFLWFFSLSRVSFRIAVFSINSYTFWSASSPWYHLFSHPRSSWDVSLSEQLFFRNLPLWVSLKTKTKEQSSVLLEAQTTTRRILFSTTSEVRQYSSESSLLNLLNQLVFVRQTAFIIRTDINSQFDIANPPH